MKMVDLCCNYRFDSKMADSVNSSTAIYSEGNNVNLSSPSLNREGLSPNTQSKSIMTNNTELNIHTNQIPVNSFLESSFPSHFPTGYFPSVQFFYPKMTASLLSPSQSTPSNISTNFTPVQLSTSSEHSTLHLLAEMQFTLQHLTLKIKEMDMKQQIQYNDLFRFIHTENDNRQSDHTVLLAIIKDLIRHTDDNRQRGNPSNNIQHMAMQQELLQIVKELKKVHLDLELCISDMCGDQKPSSISGAPSSTSDVSWKYYKISNVIYSKNNVETRSEIIEAMKLHPEFSEEFKLYIQHTGVVANRSCSEVVISLKASKKIQTAFPHWLGFYANSKIRKIFSAHPNIENTSKPRKNKFSLNRKHEIQMGKTNIPIKNTASVHREETTSEISTAYFSIIGVLPQPLGALRSALTSAINDLRWHRKNPVNLYLSRGDVETEIKLSVEGKVRAHKLIPKSIKNLYRNKLLTASFFIAEPQITMEESAKANSRRFFQASKGRAGMEQSIKPSSSSRPQRATTLPAPFNDSNFRRRYAVPLQDNSRLIFNERMLTDILRERNDQSAVQNVQGDGNCLSRTLSLLKYGSEHRYLEIKRTVLDFVNHNSRRLDQYMQHLPGNVGDGFARADLIRHLQTEGDQSELLYIWTYALALEHNIHILCLATGETQAICPGVWPHNQRSQCPTWRIAIRSENFFPYLDMQYRPILRDPARPQLGFLFQTDGHFWAIVPPGQIFNQISGHRVPTHPKNGQQGVNLY
jgi:hypothetical protein